MLLTTERPALWALGLLGLLGASGPALFAALALEGCGAPEGCLSGDDGTCLPPSPCRGLAFGCEDARLSIGLVRGALERPAGQDALAARGDVLLENARVRAVIDAIGSPHYLAPSGGALLDLAPLGAEGAGDELNQVFQATGILPGDAVRYRRMELVDRRPELVAVVVRGALDGNPEITVVTRYELRPCEPGVRVRTELFHGGREPESLFLSDAFYWGGREASPFVPLPGQGFVHPELDLLELGKAFFSVPFLAARPQAPGGSAYASLACDAPSMDAFQSLTVSAAGPPRAVVLPGDGIAFERFVAAAPGPGLSGAVDAALEARGALFDEASVTVRGRVVGPEGEGIGGDPRLASLLFYEPGKGDEARRPLSEVVPGKGGRFSLRLPSGRRVAVERHLLGLPLPEPEGARVFETGDGDVDLGDLASPRAGAATLRVVDGRGEPAIAEVVLVPSAGRGRGALGSVYGSFEDARCVPYLGPPHGGSPACNRVVLGPEGVARVAVPSGSYDAYATRGPFSTLARARLEVREGEESELLFEVERLEGLLPEGVLSADFHVHAGASFDSSLPERDRALSFVASGVDVVAATDHDVVTTYEEALAELGLGERVRVLPGVETTGHVLFYRPPGSSLPKVVGHYNFWPLRPDEDLPRNGAPWDELVEPGALFDRMEPFFRSPGVRQMNHPYASATFGRDEGYLSALGHDPRAEVPSFPDETPAGQLSRRPAGLHRNLDHDVQEVMNGPSVEGFFAYRAAWFGFLSQGILKGGTANSDSHSLAEGVLGYPRTLVFGNQRLDAFDEAHLDEDVRKGRMVGTNGPVLLACLTDEAGACRGPSLEKVRVSEEAELRVEVRAAPWIPVEEIRIYANGRLARVIGGEALARPADPFGREGLVRFVGSLPLAKIAPERNGWLVVEAGLSLPLVADLDDDGVPETTDNDGSGVVDLRDREGRKPGEFFDEPPLRGEDDPRRHLDAVAPGTYPTSFTNPLLFERGGSP